MKTKWIFSFAAALGLACACGCNPERQQARGFRLPDGDVEEGKAAFVALNCQTCHSVVGVELPPAPSPGQHNVILGGPVVKVKSYGELVTAIIHPAHDISERFDAAKLDGALSPMPQFNHVMTVDQMIDIVAFLHSRYRQREMEYQFYGP